MDLEDVRRGPTLKGKRCYSAIKRLFISGYTADVIPPPLLQPSRLLRYPKN